MGRLDAILSVGGRLDAVLSVVGRCIKPWKRREFGMGAILFEFTSKWLWMIPKYWTPLWNSFIKTKYNLQFNGCDAKLIVKTLILPLDIFQGFSVFSPLISIHPWSSENSDFTFLSFVLPSLEVMNGPLSHQLLQFGRQKALVSSIFLLRSCKSINRLDTINSHQIHPQGYCHWHLFIVHGEMDK